MPRRLYRRGIFFSPALKHFAPPWNPIPGAKVLQMNWASVRSTTCSSAPLGKGIASFSSTCPYHDGPHQLQFPGSDSHCTPRCDAPTSRRADCCVVFLQPGNVDPDPRGEAFRERSCIPSFPAHCRFAAAWAVGRDWFGHLHLSSRMLLGFTH